MNWRGLELSKQPSSHGNYECWATPDELWKAETFDGGKLWYARIKLGCHRFHGKATEMEKALELARDAAFNVHVQLENLLDQSV